ncbi:hypothetical protein [Kitasatospora paranensis]|uniref:Uncharacterized protein n=1 Tax=Kitasatospora paranensis TaxID=258053 RepID=A0ABW2G6A9_9ACTN
MRAGGDLPLSGTWTGPDGILDAFVPAVVARPVPESREFDVEGVIAEGEPVLAGWNTRALSRTGAATTGTASRCSPSTTAGSPPSASTATP